MRLFRRQLSVFKVLWIAQNSVYKPRVPFA